jgi:hypothetical protein
MQDAASLKLTDLASLTPGGDKIDSQNFVPMCPVHVWDIITDRVPALFFWELLCDAFPLSMHRLVMQPTPSTQGYHLAHISQTTSPGNLGFSG